MTNSKKIFAALALVAISATAATAQTDFGSPIGAGGGTGGTVAPFVPGLAGRGTAPGLSGNGARGLTVARTAFANAGGPTRIVNPAGGNSTLSSSFLQALAGVMGGSPTPAAVTEVTNGLTGIPAGTASALVTALQGLGAAPSRSTLVTAINAYNAAVDAVPVGSNPPAALSAIRFALFGASIQGS